MPYPASRLSAILSELKRRRVFRVAVVYAGVAFIVFQIVDATFEPLHLPDWLSTAVVILLALGFPIAVGLAWAFDITEKGVVKTPPKEEAAEAKRAPHIVIGNKTLAIVAAVAVAVAVWSWWGRPDKEAALGAKSIAVLPFANFSDQPDEWFSDGITEEIITQLSMISDLKVISRTSVMYYKGKDEPLRKIGEELGVAMILEGSVRRAGNKLRIASQLINARTDQHLWAETYDRDFTDIFAIQSDVAQQIAHALKVRISPAQMDRIEKHPTENLEAYTFYLLGRSYWNKRGKENLEKAIEYFSRAIAEDSSYALAYTGLADCYSLLPFSSWFPKEAYPRAMAAAVKALELDDKLAEAHTSLAAVKAWLEWDFSAAEREYKRAIQLNPGYATGHFWYGLFMAYTGRLDEGLTEARRALELDPLSGIINSNLGNILYWERRYDEAIDQFQKTIEIDSGFGHYGLGSVYLQKGMFEAAIEGLKKSGSPELAFAYVALGRRDEALAVLEGLEKRSTLEHVDPVFFAKAYLGLGDTEQALEALERAYEERSVRLLDEIRNDPYYDPLRDDPRFADLLRRMNFPE